MNWIGKPVGILGAGQLSLMLSEAARRLGLKPIVFAQSKEDPAVPIADDCVFGNIQDKKTLQKFFSKTDFIAFESDFLPFDVLTPFVKKKIKFVPSLYVIKMLSDKIEQKKILNRLGIPTARFQIYSPGSLNSWLEKTVRYFRGSCVLKWAQGGYDGHGVWFLEKANSGAEDFCKQALSKNIRIFAEEKICFKRELALVSVLSIKNEFKNYPLVVSQQERGICKQIQGPATKLGVPKALEKQACHYAQKLAHHLKLFGAFALEMFENKDGKLFINEIAPRVHNSGHFSLDACPTSQFENHWRAVLGLPLGETMLLGFFVMRNILAPRIPPLVAPSERLESKGRLGGVDQNIHLYWYGKKKWSPRRKLGHLNGVIFEKNKMPLLLKELKAMDSAIISFKGNTE